MPVVIVVLLRVSFDGASDIFLNPVGTITTGIPTRLPRQTFSQSVAFPINASTWKFSLYLLNQHTSSSLCLVKYDVSIGLSVGKF